jgi:hypothetical protein
MAAGQTSATTSWSFEGTGTVNIFNSLILDSQTHGLSFSGAGVYNVSNSIVTGGIKGATTYPIIRTAGALTLASNLVIANPWDGDARWISGTYTDGGGNILTSVNPQWRGVPRKGYIIPHVDDTGNFAYAQSVAALLAAKGFTGSYFLTQATWGAGDNAALRAMVSGGTMEVALHGYSGTYISLTGNAFSITEAGKTIAIDRTADTLTVSDTVTVTGFRAKTLNSIRTELTAGGVDSLGALATNLDGDTLGEVLADSSGAQASPYTAQLLIDTTGATGLYATEMKNPKAWLTSIINASGNVTDPQTGATYACRTYGSNGNSTSADTRTAAIGMGFAGFRSGKIGGTGDYKDIGNLTDVDMFSIVPTSGATYIKGSNEANTRYNARAIAFVALHTGMVIPILAHDVSEMTLDQWTWAIDEWSKMGVNVTSFQKFRDAVVASHTDDEDGTYSKTYPNGGGDYRLRPGSPAINAGVDVGLTTDFLGKPIRGLPDIGEYEFYGATGNFGFGFGMGF